MLDFLDVPARSTDVYRVKQGWHGLPRSVISTFLKQGGQPLTPGPISDGALLAQAPSKHQAFIACTTATNVKPIGRSKLLRLSALRQAATMS